MDREVIQGFRIIHTGTMKLSLIRSEEGVTAVEFALLSIPYLFLIIGTMELGMMYASATMLENGVNRAARLIRTGELQQGGGDPETVFREALCDYTSVLLDCDDITTEASEIASFSNAGDFAPQLDENGAMESQGFSVGGSNDRVLVRAGYTYTFMTPFIGNLLSGNTRGDMYFISTIVLQTEPYAFEDD